ncbi:MAG: sigma-70 family RNA polymerase sigma factor, partial [Planctomycetota bacterium]|nr:sigma-70 family RNA polymerase sigma factor [Planctomycetota bacterium]
MMQVREGDARAFEDLYRLYQKPLATFFHRLSGNPSKVEDLLQELFLRVWKAAPGYEPKAKLSTYLFRIAHNLWVNDSKKRKETTLQKIEPEIETPPDIS